MTVGWDRAVFMMTYDFTELIRMIEAHDDHEGVIQGGIGGAGRVSWRLAQIEMQCKQRCEQVVLEAFDAVADVGWHERIVEQIKKRLVRVERRNDEVLGADELARLPFRRQRRDHLQ